MNLHPAPPELLRDALATAPWAARLPPPAGAFVAAWRADGVASADDLAAALVCAEDDARAACREVTAGDHDRWAAACLALGARHALERVGGHAPTRDALAEAFAAAADAQLRRLPAARKQAVAGKSLRAAREALLHAHRAEGALAGCFERALADALSDALAPLALGLADASERAREALRRADAAAMDRHDRDQIFLGPAGLRARSAMALARLAAHLAAATLAAASPEAARWLGAMTLQLLRAMREALGMFPDADAAEDDTMTPARETPRAHPTETPMKTTTPTTTLLETLQVDATDAAWRTAGSQFVKLTRDPVAALLCRHLGPDDPALRARVAAFLQTELGAAMVSAVLAAGLTALPQAAGPVPERLARELRVRAMAGVGDTLADVLMGPLREVASSYLRDVPAPLDAAPRHVLDARPAALGGLADDVLTAAPRRA